MLKIIPFTYNNDPDELLSNTYVIVDSDNNALVVDPSKNNDNLKNYLIKNNLNLKAILLTHGHYDHFSGVERLLNEFKVDIYISFSDEYMLDDAEANCSIYISGAYTLNQKYNNYLERATLTLLNEEIEVIPTPYHTEGSVCLYLKDSNALISGDFLFCGCLGRCDLPNNAARKLKESLEKVLCLPEETRIYPGHGPFTTIKAEKANNQ